MTAFLDRYVAHRRDGSGTPVLVVGARYPDIAPSNSVRVTAGDSRRIVERDIGPAGKRTVDLLIDPATGRFFYQVETRRFAARWFHRIDAESGRIIDRLYGLAETMAPG